MGKLKVSLIILCISLFLISVNYAYAECYNEDACFKDYVKHEDKDVVVAVNRETNAVELYWSDKDNTWLKPDEAYQAGLQKTYDKKIQLRGMQRRIDRMRSESMYNTNQNSNAGRR